MRHIFDLQYARLCPTKNARKVGTTNLKLVRFMKLQNNKLPWEKRETKVAVIGDFILDEYLEGSVHRISPEAPVPVHLVKSRTVTAGGAANVARNIQLTGGLASVYGVVGHDESGNALLQILKNDGIDIAAILADSERPTIRKMRVTANNQQLVRIDWEKITPIKSALIEELCAKLEKDPSPVFLLSDYGKGSLTSDLIRRVIAMGAAKGKLIVVDPKGHDYSRYSGAFLITPNREEACRALNRDPLETHDPLDLASEIRDRFRIENVVVTLGAEGMLGLAKGVGRDQAIRLRARAREVFDVSGAGDTVVGLLSLGLASGLSLHDSMEVANVGAGVVVEKWGTQPVRLFELKNALERDLATTQTFPSTARKIYQRTEISVVIPPKSHRQKKVVFTNGCFDILHSGHVSYLEEARGAGDYLVVGVNTDSSVRALKGATRPIVPLEQRMRVLAALACVDAVVPFSEATPRTLIQEIMPDILVKGADYKIDDIAGHDIVLGAGGEVYTLKLIDGVSTTSIAQRIKEGL